MKTAKIKRLEYYAVIYDYFTSFFQNGTNPFIIGHCQVLAVASSSLRFPSAKEARPEVKRADAVALWKMPGRKTIIMYSAKRAAGTVGALQSPFVCHCYMGKILRVCCLTRRRCEDIYSAA